MSLLSTTMNYAATLANSDSFLARNISSRIVTALLCPPLSAIESIRRTLLLPFQAAMCVVKIPSSVINLVVNSTTLREFESALPGPFQLIGCALKIVALALGIFTTATLGFLSPMTNFRLHYAFGLVRDEKAEKLLEAKKLEAQKKKEAYEKMLEEQLKRINEILRLRVAETPPPIDVEQPEPSVPAPVAQPVPPPVALPVIKPQPKASETSNPAAPIVIVEEESVAAEQPVEEPAASESEQPIILVENDGAEDLPLTLEPDHASMHSGVEDAA